MKKFRSFIFVIPALLSIPTGLICSCSNKENLYITTENYSFLTSERFITIPVKFRESPNSEVYVKIEDAPQNTISLRQNVFNVTTKSLDLLIDLDDAVDEDSYISFNLTFYINHSVDQKQTFQLCNFVYYYQKYDPRTDDVLTITNKTCHSVNDHTFTYDLFFSKQPTSNTVKVELLDDLSGKLSLETDEFPVVYESEKIKSTIKLNLDLSTYQTESFYFNLSFAFVNSKGVDQKTKFYGFVASFEKQKADEVPLEYFDLEKVSNSDEEYILKGFKPSVHPMDLASYNTLLIPDNVVTIGSSAFADPNLVPNIQNIVLPSSVQHVREKAFYGCHRLYELDLCSYEERPTWIDYDPDEIFDVSSLVYRMGFVWIKNDDPRYIEALHDRGLPLGWSAFSSDKTTQDDFYDISEDGTILEGIKQTSDPLLPTIKVIRIPRQIKQINEGAFDKIKTVPYQGKDGPETRLLFLNSKIESLSPNLFKQAGISGSLFFASPYLTSIPRSAFQECNVYSDPLICDVKEPDYKSIHFVECNNLVSIGDFAFSMFGSGDPGSSLPLPHNIESIGDFAFQGHGYTKITIPHTVNSVGKFAFGDTISAEPSRPTTVIDFSDFHYKLHDQKPFYTPEWMTKEDWYIFVNTCSSSGTLILTDKIKDDFVEDEDDLEKWENQFKFNLSIPNGWSIEYKD